MLPLRLACLCILILSVFSLAYADTRSLTAEATYIMGDGETPSFAEAMALQKAKQMALEEAGTYVESYTKVQNLNLSADEILTLAGGVIQVELLEKTRTLVGDGVRFWVKIKAVVATDTMEELARRIKGKNVAEEYRDLQLKYETLTRDIDKLKQVIAQSPPAPEREAALDRIRERERSFAELQRDEVTLIRSLVNGEALISQAKQVQSLADTVVQSVLRSGYLIELGAITSTLVRNKDGLLRLELPVSIKIDAALVSSLRTAAQARRGTVEPVSIFQSDYRDAFYNGFSEWSVNGIVRKQALLRAILLGFPHSENTLEELWHLRNRLEKIALVVEFLGEKGVLARCTTPYDRINLIQPGMNLGREGQEIDEGDIRDEIASSAQYFSSEEEYQEYKRLWDESLQASKKMLDSWRQLSEEEKKREPYPNVHPLSPTRRGRQLFSNALKRWKAADHGRFVRLEIQNETKHSDTIGPYLLIINEQGVLPIELTLDERLVGQIRKTTVRLISDYKPPWGSEVDLYSSDPEIRKRYYQRPAWLGSWTLKRPVCDEG